MRVSVWALLLLVACAAELINAQVRVEQTVNAPRFYLCEADEAASDRIYRYIAVVTGSEPGEFGHPGLDEDEKRDFTSCIYDVGRAVAAEFGGEQGVLPGNGELEYEEAVFAKVLGALLYRPFFLNETEDSYGRRFLNVAAVIIPRIGGIPQDVLEFFIVRARNGKPIASGQSGAREEFRGLGSQYQPFEMRNNKELFDGLENRYFERFEGWNPADQRGTVPPPDSPQTFKVAFGRFRPTKLPLCGVFLEQNVKYSVSRGKAAIYVVIRGEDGNFLSRGSKLNIPTGSGIIKVKAKVSPRIVLGGTYIISADMRPMDSSRKWYDKVSMISSGPLSAVACT